MMRDYLRPFHLLAALAALFFFGLMHWSVPNLGGNTTPRNFFGWMIVCLTIGALFLRATHVRRLRWDNLHLAAIASPFIALLVATHLSGQSELVFTPLYALIPALFAVLLLAVAQYRVPMRGQLILLAIMAAGMLVSLQFCIWGPSMFDLSALHQYLPRALVNLFAGFNQRNNFASFTAALVLLIAFHMTQNPRLPRLLYFGFLFCLFIFAAAITITTSRVGVLGLLVGLALMAAYVLWFMPAARQRFIAPALAILCGVGLTFVWQALPQGQYRDFTNAATIQQRVAMLVVSWDLFLSAPFFGYGLGNFAPEYIARYVALNYGELYPIRNNVNDPHNVILLLLVETGLIGTLLFLAPIGLIIGRWLLQGHENWPIFFVLFPIALHLLTGFPYKASGIHYWLVGLVLLMLMRRRGVLRVAQLPPRTARLVVAANALAMLLALIVLAHAAYLSRMAFYNGLAMQRHTLTQAFTYRLRAADLAHPFLRRDLTRHTYHYLAQRTLAEGEVFLMSGYMRPLYMDKVFPHVQGQASWRLVLGMHSMLGDDAAAQALLAHVRGLHPPYAAELRALYARWQSNDPRPLPMRDMAARLQALGYPPIVLEGG